MTTNDDTPNIPEGLSLQDRLAARKVIIEAYGDQPVTGFAKTFKLSKQFVETYRIEQASYLAELTATLITRIFHAAEINREQIDPWVRKLDRLKARVSGLKERNAAAYLGEHIERDRFKTNVSEITKWEAAFQRFDDENRRDLMFAGSWYEHTVRMRSSCISILSNQMTNWSNDETYSLQGPIERLLSEMEHFDADEPKYIECAARIKARFADLQAFEAEEKLDRGVEMGGDHDILAYKNAGK